MDLISDMNFSSTNSCLQVRNNGSMEDRPRLVKILSYSALISTKVLPPTAPEAITRLKRSSCESTDTLMRPSAKRSIDSSLHACFTACCFVTPTLGIDSSQRNARMMPWSRWLLLPSFRPARKGLATISQLPLGCANRWKCHILGSSKTNFIKSPAIRELRCTHIIAYARKYTAKRMLPLMGRLLMSVLVLRSEFTSCNLRLMSWKKYGSLALSNWFFNATWWEELSVLFNGPRVADPTDWIMNKCNTKTASAWMEY